MSEIKKLIRLGNAIIVMNLALVLVCIAGMGVFIKDGKWMVAGAYLLLMLLELYIAYIIGEMITDLKNKFNA